MIRTRLVRLAYRAGYVAIRVWSAVLRPHTRGVKCLVSEGGAILLVRHAYGPRQWDLPGGFARRGEAFLETARREIDEELALPGADDPRQFAELRRRHLGRHETLGAMGVRVPTRVVEIRSLELLEAGWFDRRALPADRAEIVDEILALERGLSA